MVLQAMYALVAGCLDHVLKNVTRYTFFFVDVSLLHLKVLMASQWP